MDLNDAPPQRTFDLIPRNTIATVQIIIRMGGAGEDGVLTRSKDGGCEMLDLEFVIVDGEYAKRKIWQSAVLTGTTDGHAKAAEISRALLRGILESARNIKPDDLSEAAQVKRRVEGLGDFQNLRFIARIGVEKSKDKNFDDKNRVEAVTPEQKEWRSVEQIPSQMGLPGVAGAATKPNQPAGSAKPAQAVTRPDWAQG